MMKLIRFFVGKILLFFDRLFSPQPVHRPQEYQDKMNQQTKKMALYEFEACPFCIKVRRAIKKMNLSIELRNVQKVEKFHDELLKEGGIYQVPCLRIEKDDGSIQWLYESSDIIDYLQRRFAER